MGAVASHSGAQRVLSEMERKVKAERATLTGGGGDTADSDTSPLRGTQQRTFTLQELAAFDGRDGKPVYVSLLSDVFDVSSDLADFTKGEFRALAGRDASRALATMSLVDDEAANTELADLTPAQLESLQAWKRKFEHDKKYPKVGRLLLPPPSPTSSSSSPQRQTTFTHTELRQFNGVDNLRHTVLVGINGNVYDVTLAGWKHYGPGGKYAQFAGRDASRALACMSFTDEYLEDPSLDKLTAEQREALANWAAQFDVKYPVVGKLIEA